MPLVADFSSWFNNPEDADVLLHLSTADPAADTAEYATTYHAHAVLLRAGSDYFQAQLTSDWQQQPNKQRRTLGSLTRSSTAATAAASAASPGIRFELVEHVEEGELEAMEQLLRLMYLYQVPADVQPDRLLQMLRLADRYQAQRFTQLLLSHLAAKGKDAITLSAAVQLFRMPPGVKTCPAFKEFSHTCGEVIVSQYADVPAVIQSDELRQQFCELPHAAVLAWAGSDQLQVHSENCVVYLLSAWVKAQQQQGGHGVSAEQLEQLAHQVRVLQLGPAYQHFVLPALKWFEGCDKTSHRLRLLAHQGVNESGEPVFPAPALSKGSNSANSWKWLGPAAWAAGPRRNSSGSRIVSTLLWELGSVDQAELFEGLQVYSKPVYLNGFQVQASATKKGSEHQVALGVYFGISPSSMLRHGVPWPEAASVSVRQAEFKVSASAAAGTSQTLKLFQSSVQGTGFTTWGYPDILQRSAPTIQELVTPLLVDGKLLLEMQVSGIDLPA